MPNITEDRNQYLEKDCKSNGLMPHRSPYYDFPFSRDWEDIDCRATGCMFNRNEKCAVPSICKIGNDGKCAGFKAKEVNIRQIDGD